jgi:hypothetical protein
MADSQSGVQTRYGAPLTAPSPLPMTFSINFLFDSAPNWPRSHQHNTARTPRHSCRNISSPTPPGIVWEPECQEMARFHIAALFLPQNELSQTPSARLLMYFRAPSPGYRACANWRTGVFLDPAFGDSS